MRGRSDSNGLRYPSLYQRDVCRAVHLCRIFGVSRASFAEILAIMAAPVYRHSNLCRISGAVVLACKRFRLYPDFKLCLPAWPVFPYAHRSFFECDC